MRVLYLHQYFVSPQASGGTRSYEFARRLVKNGHQVTLITSSAFLTDDYRTNERILRRKFEGIDLVVVQVPYSNKMPYKQRIQVFLKFALHASWEALHCKADVVFATSTPLTIAIPGICAKLWQRIPLVFEVRDLWPELPIAIGALRNPVAKMLARGLEWVAYHASVHVVALSPGMAQGVMRRGILSERVTVIPNSCDVGLFDVPKECGSGIRERLHLAPGQPLIVYAGTFGHLNGVGYLVEIAAAMRNIAPEVRFLLVGTGVECEKIVEQARTREVLNENLWIWDPIPKAKMPNLLAAATVATSLFVPLPQTWNNSANKFFDALAAGKPIAINHGGWQAELLEESGAGIVLPPCDPVEAAKMLAAFVRDENRLRKASRAAHKLAYTRFSRDAMASKLEQVLCDAVGVHPLSPETDREQRRSEICIVDKAALLRGEPQRQIPDPGPSELILSDRG